MKQSFTCKNTNCNKVSQLNGIEQTDGHYYVVCEYCQSKNELAALPKIKDAPTNHQVIGLLNKELTHHSSGTPNGAS